MPQKNKHNYYRGNDRMKNLSRDLKKQATKIIRYEKKEMILSTNEENKLYHKQKVCYICKKEFSTNDNDIAFKK